MISRDFLEIVAKQTYFAFKKDLFQKKRIYLKRKGFISKEKDLFPKKSISTPEEKDFYI